MAASVVHNLGIGSGCVACAVVGSVAIACGPAYNDAHFGFNNTQRRGSLERFVSSATNGGDYQQRVRDAALALQHALQAEADGAANDDLLRAWERVDQLGTGFARAARHRALGRLATV